MLAPLAFPDAALGCAQSTAERLRAEPGAAQRELRDLDEELLIERPRPLSLGAVQALAVPGRCGVGDAELELHPATGHTGDGMAVWIPWARVLVSGDYLSDVEIPGLRRPEAWLRSAGYPPQGALDEYLATLERLRPLVEAAEHVVPGHGTVLDREAALRVLEQDVAYLQALRERGAAAELPRRRRSKAQRELHERNVARLKTLVIVAIGAPAWIGSPSTIGSSTIVPALWAVISFSIFIASMMQSSWPSSTVSPCLTSTFHMLPCSGEGSTSAPPALPEDFRAERFGAFAPGAVPLLAGTPPPANGGPTTRTSKRLPETSTE